MITTGDNNPRCRIAVDAMGGDHAPLNAVLGAIEALDQSSEFDLYLVGKKNEVKKIIANNNLEFDSGNIINADEVIEMGESPAASLKAKKNSSIVIGAKLVKDKKADAFVSAGNTGAMMAASTLITGRIKGVGRPTIGAEMPNVNGVCYLYDVGSSKDSKPVHLFEYAVMGSSYAVEMGGVKNPKVGVLSMGEDEGKGNDVSEAAVKLLRETRLNFIGNVEGRDILAGEVDVVVCDGYVGNVLLKFGESVPILLKHLLKQTADNSFIDKIKIGFTRGTLKKALRSLDYQEYGGVPLLGINGISIIGHGSSTPKAFKNMVLRANEMHRKQLVQKLSKSISEYSNLIEKAELNG
jgi:glycerol-3-phosphate acyltransferase PlsX